ncbi:MAG: response regulator transcription factor [Lachnospiraceae bacterium]|nr:response regulator transcription factor [Lachnospiraceae bacterium]
MNNKATIIIIEDEKAIGNFISTMLTAAGYKSITALTGHEGISLINSHCPDLILLDLGLPDMDGLKIIKEVRSYSSIPIIIISARTYEREKVEALDLGADDYITKPFGSSELMARIRTSLRHANKVLTKETGSQTVFKTGDLLMDFENRRVFVGEKEVHLTLIEYKILVLFAKYVGRVLTYEYIINSVWGNYAQKNSQLLRVNMANIRHKIEENPGEPIYIKTEVGIGYRMIDYN